MTRSIAYSIARYLAVIAISLQALLPAAAALIQPEGVDVARYLCLPQQSDNDAALNAVAGDLRKLLQQDSPLEAALDGHCPFCTLVDPFALPAVLSLKTWRAGSFVGAPFGTYDPGLFHLALGPPLGPRAPPFHN